MIILDFLKNVPNELEILIISSLPIFELRGALPVALKVYDMGILKSYILAVFGNMIPVFIILFGLDKFAFYLEKRSVFFRNYCKKVKEKYTLKFEKLGAVALILFVAIPFPLTGAWTGALAAFLFRIPFWKSVRYLFIGILIAGVIVTLLTLGIFNIL